MVVAQTHSTVHERRAKAQTAPLLLSVADVAARLSLGVTYTRRLIDRGEIKSVRIGKRVLVPQQFLDDYLARLLHSGQRMVEIHDGQRLHQEA